MNKIFGILLLVYSVVAFAAPEFRAATVKDTLVFWAMDDGVNSGFALQKITRKFAQQSKVPVKVRFLSWGSGFDELNRVLAMDSVDVVNSGAEIPDVIQLGSSWVSFFAKAGYISEVDSLLEMADSTRFFSEAMKATHIGHGKETYSLPWFLDVRGFFINERLWLLLGLNDEDVDSYPKLFGTLRSVAKSGLKNDAGRSVTPFEFGVRDDWTGQQQMAPILWSFGGDIVAESLDSGKVSYRSALTDSATLVGLRHYFKFLRDEELSPNGLHENSSQNTDRFIRSEMLMIFGTSEIIRKMEFGNDMGGLMESSLAKDGVAMVPAPKGPNGSFTFVGGSHLALPKIGIYGNEEKRRNAIELFLYMLRADNVDYYSRQIGFLPADRGLIRIWGQDERYYQLINGLESNGRSFLNIPEWGSIEVAVNDMVNHVGKALLERHSDINEEMTRLVVDAHFKINEILGSKESANVDSLKQRVRLSLMQPVEEQKNDLRDTSEKSSSLLFVGVGTGAALLLVVVIVAVRRRR